jgi:hypothetical protein
MLALLADENLHGDIVRGLRRRNPELDIVRVQDIGLSGADDPTVLERAAAEGRILLTHDVATITRYAYERVQAGLPMPGVLEIKRSLPIGVVIEDILLFAECSLVIVLPHAPNASAPNSPASAEEEETLIDAMIASGASLPVLPEAANSREWMYGDHG